ncbi:MAG: lipopolysaccharide heptosyltransferase I [Candidatus Abyssubacteria bacterium]
MKDTSHKSPRILLVRLSAIGDVVRTLPALSSLRREYPNAYIAWAVEDKASGILEDHPQLDVVLVFERKQIVRALNNPAHWPNAFSLLTGYFSRLRNAQFDMAFDFHGILKSGLMTFLSRAPLRIGFERRFVKESSHIFTNRKVPLDDNGLPRVLRNLELVKPYVSPGNLTEKPILGIGTRHREKAETFVREKFGGARPLIAVHPGASRPLKKWPARSFAQLCDLLSDSLAARVMLTWGPGEREEAERIRALAKTKPELAMQTTSLLELAALFEMSDLLVSVDSGPMHIGSAVGTPVVAIFGPTDVRVNAPQWPPSQVVSAGIECQPCDEDCKFAQCMEEVAPSRVLEAATELLGRIYPAKTGGS